MIFKSNYLPALILASLVWAACAKLPQTQSRWAPTLDQAAPYSGYDADSKVSWQIANDQQNLYINLRSPMAHISHNILLNGIQVVVDTLGKKKGQFTLKYPLGMNAGEPGKPLNPMPRGGGPDPLGLNAPREGSWTVNEETTYLDNQSRTLGFDYNMRFDSLQTLHYRATIPLSRINRSAASTAPLAVGILMKAGTVDAGNSGPGLDMSGGMPGSQNGMTSPGMPASNRPSALPTGGSGTNTLEDAGSIKIWTGVKLNTGK
jgi:hypothetical protein